MLIHSVIEVDDDLTIDNRLESETKFRYKDENGITSSKIVSGYLEPYTPIHPEDYNISKSEVNDNDVIICKFNPESLQPADMQYVHKMMQAEFPNNKVLMIANDLDLLSQNPNEAIALLEKMIAHIRIVNV